MQPTYLREPKKISFAIENGISRLLESNEERTKVEIPSGRTYVFPTAVFNKLRGYFPDERTISSLTGIEVALNLTSGEAEGYKILEKPKTPERLNYIV